jgi:hypothetical protein
MEQLSFHTFWSDVPTAPEAVEADQEAMAPPPVLRPTVPLKTQGDTTFADVDEFIQSRTDWSSNTRSMMRASCRRAAWSITTILARRKGEPFDNTMKELDLGSVPFSILDFNQAWDGQSARSAGFNENKSFQNVRSVIRRIGREMGYVPASQAPSVAPGNCFMPLLEAADDYEKPATLRFIAWCQDRALTPADVESHTLVEYTDFVRGHLIKARIKDVAGTIVRLWNVASRTNPTWPQTKLTKPGKARVYTLPFSAYPPSLCADIDRFVEWMAGTDRAGPFSQPGRKRPMRPSTIKNRLTSIRLAAWARVATGQNPHDIIDLKCLVSPEAAEAILTYYWGRAREHRSLAADDEATQHANGSTSLLQNIGITLAIVAEHHCHIEGEQLKQVRALAAAARVPPRGKPTAKNRERLRQFDDLRMRADLLSLSRQLMNEALEMMDTLPEDPSKQSEAARLARVAILIGILCRIPLRIHNLCSIRLGKNLKFVGDTDDSLLLTFAEHETKNWIELEFSVGPRLRDLIKIYIDRFLPFFAGQSPDFPTMNWLFPSGAGRSGHMSTGNGRKIITRTIHERVGATVNPHLFRSLAVKLCLERSPGALEQCRLLLGDKSLNVVLRHYAAMEEKEAARRQDALVDAEERRGAAYATRTGPKRTRTRRKQP